ncbi:serine/threonine-protein kinase ULK1a isoform X3 [Dunckerocampus dactyliophorus]|uniref:serine/threonine-protein kinase ULK1a isoform X3 n=1 Tax=Dunckerocampus dactyliophorus TaxID=161453 RepID=UPI00240770CC|nr:serine/threonine-protein kinase ULK1a isoform X3 [Dunckerocampus dactyliophorus]
MVIDRTSSTCLDTCSRFLMESVGRFEFSRKDLIGHGAFAVVFKGRHKEKHEWEVAVKCINKKNLSKSHSLLGKEIKILKELKHRNIVRLLDCQEIGGCVYLVMEYCNGGDLAEYLQSKGTLSEDTIRVFLQQIAQAMKVLQSKGILHRDLKPQNILLCHPMGRRSSSINTCVKIADFGFARHLQTNTMAATLCGSPMYMAPEVIMSQNYDAKADLWSIGTIIYQCLTGKAPFHANTPQELRLYYECNRTLVPSIPKETSSNLRQLLLGLLQRNHKDRISFDEFFHHSFLETGSGPRKCSPTPVCFYPSSASASSSSSSSTSHSASPQMSNGERRHNLQTKLTNSPVQNTVGFHLKEIANQDSRNSSSYTEDYVMVHPGSPCEYTCEEEVGSPIETCLLYSGCSLIAETGLGAIGRTPPSSPSLQGRSKPAGKSALCGGSHSEPIPVPTQIQNYQRLEQNLQPIGSNGSTGVRLCYAGYSESSSPCGGHASPDSCCAPHTPRPTSRGSQAQQYSPLVGTTPKTSEQTLPLSTRTGWPTESPDKRECLCHKQENSCRTMSDLHSPRLAPVTHTNYSRKPTNKKGPFKRSQSIGRLSDMLLKAAFGAQLLERRSNESLCCESSMDIAAPPTGCHTGLPLSASPPIPVFTMGSPASGTTPDLMLPRMRTGSPNYITSAWLLNTCHQRSRRNSDTESMDATPHSLVFYPPELPEDTLMEAHTDALSDLQFTLAFVHCIMEMASSKDAAPLDPVSGLEVSFLEHSLLTDQISLLSREWSYAEQLALYMKAVECLSTALHGSKEHIQQGRLLPSSAVKQVIKKLNELYKGCVTCCRSLSDRLQSFLLDKQKLMDRFNGLTAEKLIYCHSVQMVQSAALDEMFHCGTGIVQRYHKALLLLEGLSRFVTEQKDIDSIEKCKQCIERRLSVLQI